MDKDVTALKVTDTIGMVYYIDEDGGLYRGKGGTDDFERIARDVVEVDITSDGKTCYYLDDEDTLVYVDKNGEDTKICENVASFCITADNYVLYLTDYEKDGSLISTGKLYGCKNGKDGELIAKDVYTVWTTQTGAYYRCSIDVKTGTCEIYGAASKLMFEKIAENVYMSISCYVNIDTARRLVGGRVFLCQQLHRVSIEKMRQSFGLRGDPHPTISQTKDHPCWDGLLFAILRIKGV